MRVTLDEARKCVHNQTLDATTLTEVRAAQQALREWLKAHPEDEWMRDGFEQLSLMEDIALEQENGRRKVL